MSEQTIVEQCSPTLAGLKTANLFPCKFESKEMLWREIRRLNQMLSSKGVRLIPVQVQEHFALMYLYRPKKLESDIQEETCSELLRVFGYRSAKVDECICELIQRFKTTSTFPHEIGLFLGYPPEDVKGFIEHHGKECKCIGCWKVYGDAEKAKKCFENYKTCTRIYKEQYAKGRSIERLTVAVE